MIVALESAGNADELKAFGRMVAMHVAARPIRRRSIRPASIRRRSSARKTCLPRSSRRRASPRTSIEKIVESGLKTFYKEVCLLDQGFIFDDKKSVAQAIKEAEGKVGGPIKVTGFVRYALGEGIDRPAAISAAKSRRLPARISVRQ